MLVRPSYVLGGQGRSRTPTPTSKNSEVINRYGRQDHPILVDKYLCKKNRGGRDRDGEEILIPGIMEHIERSGVHSGDSISVYPAFLCRAGWDEIVDTTGGSPSRCMCGA